SRFVGVTDYTQPMAAGSGYFLYAYGTQPGTGAPILPTAWDVAGREPGGDVVTPLSYASADPERRFNLLGNPYAAPIDWHAVQSTGRFTATYAVWDPAASSGTGNYAYYSVAGVSTGRANRYVGPTQGFWTESTISSPFGLTWDRAWKAATATPTTVGRGDEAAQLRFRFEGQGLTSTEPVAIFLDGGESGEDIYDATWLSPLSADYAAAYFVRSTDAAPLVFEGRPAGALAEPLRFAVEATRAGTYTLSWPDIDLAPAGPLVLTDLVTGVRVDLRAEGGYTFAIDAPAQPRAVATLPLPAARTVAVRFEVSSGVVTSTPDEDRVTEVLLGGPRPNPAAGRTSLRFALPDARPVRIAVYDLLGRTVATVAEGVRAAGWHEVHVETSPLAAGVYVVRLEAGDTVRSVRLSVVR
ncbi:MAG TPA: T9SS type A sorting domain-containing protein, partial [Rubricoccaceae bacterium]